MKSLIFSCLFFFSSLAYINCQNASLVGTFQTESGEAVPGVMVTLKNLQDVELGTTVTNGSGFYQFDNLTEGETYKVVADKADDPQLGHSTYDLVLTARHILGMQPLSSPYKIIAADVNQSGAITTYDLISMRAVILSMIPNFPNNKTWVFIAEAYEFPDPNNPFFPGTAAPNQITLDATVTTANFIGIKLGNIN